MIISFLNWLNIIDFIFQVINIAFTPNYQRDSESQNTKKLQNACFKSKKTKKQRIIHNMINSFKTNLKQISRVAKHTKLQNACSKCKKTRVIPNTINSFKTNLKQRLWVTKYKKYKILVKNVKKNEKIKCFLKIENY